VPTAVLTTLRVLDHAADRTRGNGQTDGPGGPGLSVRDDTRHDQPERAPVGNGVTVESRGWRVQRRSA
jgi:hypothetical protein